MRVILTILLFVVPHIAMARCPALKEMRQNITDSRQFGWACKGMDSVLLKLKDSKSAEFRDIFYSRKGGTHVTCGKVNSKNSFGGYGGFQRFVSAGSVELTFLEEEVAGDFGPVWAKMCE